MIRRKEENPIQLIPAGIVPNMDIIKKPTNYPN
jgi:hypothetical protein